MRGRRELPRAALVFCAAAAALSLTPAVVAQTPDVVDKMERCTVLILVKEQSGVSTGSGFVVGDGSVVVTNWHVVEATSKGGEGVVALKKGDVRKFAVRGFSESKDLAVLEVEGGTGRPAAAFATREAVRKTEAVYAAGFPGAALMEGQVDMESTITEVKISKGIVSAFVKSEAGTQLYQTDTPMNPGNSGGPLFNACGHVAGVNVMKSLTMVLDVAGNPVRVAEGEGVGFAIVADEVMAELDRLGVRYGAVRAPCDPPGSPPGWNAAVVAGVAASLLLGVAAVALTFWKGRRKVRETVHRVSEKRPPPAAVPVLKGVAGEFAGSSVELAGGPLYLGRDPKLCNLVFPAFKDGVSKRHCSVSYDDRGRFFQVEDHWSTNGTFTVDKGRDAGAGGRMAPGETRRLLPGDRFYVDEPGDLFEVGWEE